MSDPDNLTLYIRKKFGLSDQYHWQRIEGIGTPKKRQVLITGGEYQLRPNGAPDYRRREGEPILVTLESREFMRENT